MKVGASMTSCWNKKSPKSILNLFNLYPHKFFKMALRVTKYFGYFYEKNCCQKFSKVFLLFPFSSHQIFHEIYFLSCARIFLLRLFRLLIFFQIQTFGTKRCVSKNKNMFQLAVFPFNLAQI